MRVKLMAHRGGLRDIVAYEGELPEYDDTIPPKVIVMDGGNQHGVAFVYADTQDEGAHVYFDAFTFHLIHYGRGV